MDKADIVIIGSGVGGSAVAHQLAGSGAKILILEFGDFLPNEPENSDPNAVFLKSRYKTHHSSCSGGQETQSSPV